MDDTIVEIRFTGLGEARDALHHLERLDREGRLAVRGAALVQRSGQGEPDLKRRTEEADGLAIPQGGMARTVVDVLRGPVGTLYEWPAEVFYGHGHGRVSPREKAEREVTVEEMTRSLEPGVTLVVAEIADPDPEVLDAALGEVGGNATRRPASEVYAEAEAAEESATTDAEEPSRKPRPHRPGS